MIPRNRPPITLLNLISRIELDTHLIKKHPEHKEMLERRIQRNKELIVKCVLQCKNEYILEQITLKEEGIKCQRNSQSDQSEKKK